MLEGAWETICQSVSVVTSYLTSPNKRLFIGYLFSTVVIAYWVFRRLNIVGSFLNYLFPKRVWLSNSACLDYQLVIFNSFFKVALLGQFLVYGVEISTWVDDALIQYFGAVDAGISYWSTIIGYTITMTILGDFTVYVVHRLMHQIPALWAFHSVHHSATTLTPVTQLRLHPVELIINNLRSLIVFGLVMGIFRYVSNHHVETLAFLGVNIFSFLFFAVGANLRHSHIPLKYWHAVEHVFISPFQHQIHHSTDARHYNQNFGSKLAIWDWFFGTLVPSRGTENLRFGLRSSQSQHETLGQALIEPFLAVNSEPASTPEPMSSRSQTLC